ncbi:hypothetical protein BpHYR1_050660 [Brachionus plicatilis]|uniref:Uncharacterized protein n=1 Tax=Brachionus plicatilis TaxID=10195 RepID=A0A3M7P9B0_BRAPC|nr:hypothetical protein BpHYR1_050660 [Brachionus plicatilis]
MIIELSDSAPFGLSVKDFVKSGGSVHLLVSVAVYGIFLRSYLRLRPIRQSHFRQVINHSFK